MAQEIRKNVANFMPMGSIAGQRVKEENIEVDKSGKPINPHIPQFIAKAPWYLESEGLHHQRRPAETVYKTDWYRRGERGPAATKYRKGACENCGASTHSKKDCLDRPRKVGAKWTGRDIAPDDIIQDVNLSWDAKRDAANGYDFDSHTEILKDRHDRITAIRGDDDSEKLKDDVLSPMNITSLTKERTNTHMRIREDTASYLAKGAEDGSYDPKTRSTKSSTPSAGTTIDKQGFVRAATDAATFEKMQSFAWDENASKNKFGEIHVQGNPSLAEQTYKEQTQWRIKEKEGLLSKYGTEANPLPDHLLEDQEQREYTRSGALVAPKVIARSKYPEDILSNGHRSVYGSWYDVENHRWGYKCCKNTLRNAYCTS